MNFFEEATLRLKQQLNVTEDQEVAAALGLSKHAWMGRKKRESFPFKEVAALAHNRPELKLDYEWIATGVSNKMETAGVREAGLLQCFRKLSDREQQRLYEIALLWSGEMALALPAKGEDK